MNSVEEISTYKQDFVQQQRYPRHSVKTAATTYDFPEHPPKKDKKWSFGNLFRRKKKDESDSSSEDELQKKKKRKPDKRKKSAKAVGTFDHIVMPAQNRGSYIISNGYSKYEDSGVLSDPSSNFASQLGRPLPRIPSTDNKKDSVVHIHANNSPGSVDGTVRKSRRDKAKLRAAARRDTNRNGSSSDEDSQRSYSSSRFKSDESLSRQRDGSSSRKSRIARTERYIRRLSKDDESILNREAMQRQARENWQLKLHEERANYGVSPSRSPILSTTPKTPECYVNSASLSQPNFSGLFTIPPSHSNYSKYKSNNSYINNSCSSSTQEVDNKVNNHSPNTNCFNIRSLSCDSNIHKSPSPETHPEIMHVQFPIGRPNRHRNLTIEPQLRQPPPPPPRDPRRIVATQYESRPSSHCFDKILQRNYTQNPHIKNHWHAGYRTASEDHIPTEPKQPLAPRPSSVTNETRQPRYIKRHVQESADRFQYLTEKKPRSRKPIFIQSTDKINTENFNQSSSINFWKQKELENSSSKSTSSSPQIFTAQTHVQTKIFLPSVVKNEPDFINRSSSPFKPISSPKREITSSVDSLSNEFNQTEVKRKSANLEEALDELEAIYKSLHLGDEDLLERAEQREISIATQKLIDSKSESYPTWGSIPRGAMSDSSFSYEPYNAVESPKKKKILKKSQTLDRRNDDMAYRKLNKDRANTIGNPQSVLASVSYLLTSPVHCPQDDAESLADEPDVTLDDVVYRSIKHANNSLKVIEPQPPFGIPIGPITPAPNSDYLHAVPENVPRYNFKHKKVPDVVKDDLAFRNLRKDPNKEQSPDEFPATGRKKRAVRSLSANISNIMQRDDGYDNEFNKASLTDIADAMEIARQILKEKDNRIASTKRAFLSDSETKYRKPGVMSASSTETITESRLNFLNEMRSKEAKMHDYLHTKPPRGSKSKESTPVPENTSFEDLLTALAVEARETSDRITNELNNLDDTLNKRDLDQNLSDIDAVSEHAKMCEKLLECVVESTELIAATKTESNPIEQVEHIETSIPESVANIVTTRVVAEASNPLDAEVHSASEPDYENLGSAESVNKSPFEEHKAELVATFKELNKLSDEEKEIGGVV